MARRLFRGHKFSENGWPYVDQGSCQWFQVAAGVTMQIQEGAPFAILGAFARDYHANVEPIFDPDCCCWTPDNSVDTSNHPGGTACDIRWQKHPFQVRGTFTPEQLATIQKLLDFYEGMVFWAGVDWSKGGWGSPIDEMHWQMGYDTYDQANDRPFPKVQDFIARKIRADGYSTFRRGNTVTPPPATSSQVDVLARATGITQIKAQEILVGVVNGVRDSQCTNANRIAMWLAQMGHESASFVYTEEIASGAAYEGRADLGNTQPGDGVRFKGRSWIQITGRSNYTELSQWAFGQGIVPSADFFVADSTRLAQIQYAGLGPAWYWVVDRPQINGLCDVRNLTAVTQAINGGQNGAPDRLARYNRALALGDQLLALTAPAESLDPLEELLMANPAVPSLSIYATPGEPPVPILTMIASQDAHGPHEPYVEKLARAGDADSLMRLARTAAGKGPYGAAAFAVNQASGVLAEIETTHPEFLRAALAAQKGA